MIEKLLVSLLLVRSGFIDEQNYMDLLDNYFSKETNNILLCELECSINKIDDSINMLVSSVMFDEEIFIKVLLETLEKIHDENKFSLQDFVERGYILWNNLPISNSQAPLDILCYAGDPLSYGDEIACREFLSELFNYL